MAFGLKRHELIEWKKKVSAGEIAFLTHYWFDKRFPEYKTVTKVGCSDLDKLYSWGQQYGLQNEWIDKRGRYPHFDLMGKRQLQILIAEGLYGDILKFRLEDRP